MLKSVNRKTLIPGALAIATSLLLLAAGCSGNGAPRGLLSKNEMVSAMTELYLVEQKASTVGVSRDSTGVLMREMSPALFNQLGTNDSIFRMSFEYYIERPMLMEEIYNALIDSLNLREQKMISNEVKK